MSRRQWTKAVRRTGHALPENEKRAIGQACEALIEKVLKPRYVPEVRPSEEFNYAIGIYGKWHGNKYRLIQRYRSDHEDAIAPEFDWPFARLEYVGRDRFDLAYFRHTEQWHTVHRGVSLAQALSLLETDGIFQPIP